MSIHITPHDEGWQVKSSGAKKAYKVKRTQKEAIEVGKTVAKNQKTDTKIHNRKGQFRDGSNYKKSK